MRNALRAVSVAVVLALVIAWVAPAASRAADKKPAKPAGTKTPAKKAPAKKAPASTPVATKPAARKPTKRPAPVKDKVELKDKAKAEAQRKHIAHVRLSGAIANAPSGMALFSFGDTPVTLREWMHRLAAIRRDERIHAVALEIGSPSVSWAHAQELADAIRRLSEVKPVHVHLTSAGTSGYLLASAGKTVSMEPMGQILLTGLAAELTFFRGTLDWLGIKPQFIQIGKFKGASEPFSRTGPSKELAGEYNKILDDLYDQLVSQIASQRKLSAKAVRAAIDRGPFTATAAQKLKLVDRLESLVAWRERITRQYKHKNLAAEWKKDFGKKKAKTLDFSNPFALLSVLMKGPSAKKIHDPTIAIIHAEGVLMPGKSGESLFGSKTVGSATLATCFDEVAADKRIKAVVFRIDSPGGSALASELIHQAVRRCAAQKPVIASIAQTGASGGYYIAVGSKTILADAAGLVGSIGVVSGKLSLEGLMDKVGIRTHAITRGKNAGLMLSRPWTDREKAVMRSMAQDVYSVFTKRVKDSRGKRIGDVEKVAQGRIFTARQAKAQGLVDQIGGLREAVELARKQAKLDSCYYLTLPKPPSLMDMLGGGLGVRSAPLPAGMAALGHLAAGRPCAYLLTLAELLGRERVLMAMPHHVSIQY